MSRIHGSVTGDARHRTPLSRLVSRLANAVGAIAISLTWTGDGAADEFPSPTINKGDRFPKLHFAASGNGPSMPSYQGEVLDEVIKLGVTTAAVAADIARTNIPFGSAFVAAAMPPVLSDMQSIRGFMTYQPAKPFNPTTSTYPSDAQLAAQLRQIKREKYIGIVTYSLDGPLAHIPRIAKEKARLKYVVAGLFIHDEAQFQRELVAAKQQAPYIDAYIVGNEVLLRDVPGWSRERLTTEIASLAAATGRPCTTAEAISEYEQDPLLIGVGSFVCPNIQPFSGGIRDVNQAVADVQAKYQWLVDRANGRPVIIHEAWWPSRGLPPATSEDNQAAFFVKLLNETTCRTITGEYADQFWKV